MDAWRLHRERKFPVSCSVMTPMKEPIAERLLPKKGETWISPFDRVEILKVEGQVVTFKVVEYIKRPDVGGTHVGQVVKILAEDFLAESVAPDPGYRKVDA